MKKIIISIALLASCQIVYSQSNTSGKVNLDPSAITNIVTVQSISQSTVDMKDPTNVNFQETVATTKVSGTPGVDKSISRQSEETNTSIKEMARNAELTTAKRESGYVRKTNLDLPTDFSTKSDEMYQRKTSQDIPVDFSNGVAEVYVRKESMNSKEPKIQNEKSTAVDENSSVYSVPVKISSKPSAVNESTPSSITNEPSNKNSAINNPTRPTPSGKSSID